MRSQRRRQPLSRERIESAALALIEKHGLQDFSTRKLAAALHCEAMSIYHHFPSKAHLMDALLDRVIASIEVPAEDLPWHERMRRFLYSYRAMALKHPEFFQFMALHRTNTRGGLAMLERILRMFEAGGFDIETTARLFRAVGYYLNGAALDETAGYARGPSAAEPVPAAEAAREFPLVARVNPYFQPKEREATFALGLEIMLGGVVERAPKRKRRRTGSGPA